MVTSSSDHNMQDLLVHTSYSIKEVIWKIAVYLVLYTWKMYFYLLIVID